MKEYKYIRFQERGKGDKDIEIKPYLKPAMAEAMLKCFKRILMEEIAEMYAIKRREK